MEDLIKKLEEDVMELEEGVLKLDTVLADIDEWDSLSKLSLMALAKKDYKKTLTAQQIREFVTVEDICNALI